MDTRGRAAARTAILGLAAVLVVAGSACGDDGGAGDEGTEENAGAEGPADTTGTTGTTGTRPGDGDEQAGEEISVDEAMSAYEDCLDANGVDPGTLPGSPDPGMLSELGGAPADALAEMGVDPGFADAHDGCWPAVEDVLAGAPAEDDESASTTVDRELAQQMYDAVICLNDRGYDLLIPGEETGPLVMQPRDPSFDMSDEAFIDDQLDCQRQAGAMIPG